MILFAIVLTGISGIVLSKHVFLTLTVHTGMSIAFDQAEKEVKDLQQRTRGGIEVVRADDKL